MSENCEKDIPQFTKSRATVVETQRSYTIPLKKKNTINYLIIWMLLVPLTEVFFSVHFLSLRVYLLN